MKTLNIKMYDDRFIDYEDFISLDEVKFGPYVFIRITCTGKEHYLSPDRVREMTVEGV